MSGLLVTSNKLKMLALTFGIFSQQSKIVWTKQKLLFNKIISILINCEVIKCKLI